MTEEMLVHKTVVQSRNFITDFGENIKNIVGGRLKSYEAMIDLGIEQASKELFKEHPNVKSLKIQITEFKNASIAITLYGETDAE